MKNFLKNKFALTDDGVKGTIKASIYSFLVFVINMFPAILLMILMDQFLLNHPTVSYTHLTLPTTERV